MKCSSIGGARQSFVPLFSIFVIATSLIGHSAANADYPPSVQILETGKPLIDPVAPKVSGTAVIVPRATSNDIPLLIGEPVSNKTLLNKVLTNKSVEQSPVKLSNSLTIGGIGANEKAPLATISTSRKFEIQFAKDVPTRVLVTGLKPNASGEAYFVGAKGQSFSLGSIKVDSVGKVSIPALTFNRSGLSYSIKLVINGKTTAFSIRSVR